MVNTCILNADQYFECYYINIYPLNVTININTGFPWVLKSPENYVCIFKAPKVLKLDIGPDKVMKSASFCSMRCLKINCVNIYFCGVVFFKVVVLTVDASYHYHCALAYLFQVTLDHISLLKQPIRP